MSIQDRLRLETSALARLLIELDSNGDPLPASVFDELAEAALETHAVVARAVLDAPTERSKIERGMELAVILASASKA